MSNPTAGSAANRAFLRACAITRPEQWNDPEAALQQLDAADWKRVADMAEQHGFVGLLARNLTWAKERTGTEIPITGWLAASRRGHLVQQLARKAAARRVADALGARNIPFVIFKGVVLAEEVYGDLSLRGFRDCDVMVPMQHLDEAYEVALQAGYALAQFNHARELVAVGAHAAGMVHRDGTSLDLHWSISPDLLAEEQIAIVWRHCRSASAGQALPGMRLSPEMTLIHIAKHFHSHQYTSIKPLVDFYVAALRFQDRIDQNELAAAADALGLRSVLEIAARLCDRWFFPGTTRVLGIRRPGWAARAAPRVIDDKLLLEAPRSSRIGNWLRYLLVSGSFAALRRGVAGALLPGKLVLTQFFNRPYRPGLYPRYYWRQLVKVVTLSNK